MVLTRLVALVAVLLVTVTMAKISDVRPLDDMSHDDGDDESLLGDSIIAAKPLGDSAELGASGASLITGESTETLKATEGDATVGACGDGTRGGTEECDDGNTSNDDGCNSVCKVEGGYMCSQTGITAADVCANCGDTQCTTFFGRQSRCLDTIATREKQVTETGQNAGADTPQMESFLQLMESGEGAYERAASGFCQCAAQWCKLDGASGGAMDFTCMSTNKGWARTTLSDPSCTCATGFCSMSLGGSHTGESHCTPLHASMIANAATGACECRPAVVAVNSTDPSLARAAEAAACKITPVEPVVVVKGGADKYGTFECAGSPYVIDDSSDQCASCKTDACLMDRDGGNFLCFATGNTSSGVSLRSAPYTRNGEGKCECGTDQCLKPNGDHSVCRDLTGAAPYGPNKQADGKCGCSAASDVCRVDTAGGFRCVHMATDNFAEDYQKAQDGKCDCKFGYCKGPDDPDTGRLVCRNAQADSPYQRKTNKLTCECKPGSCMFPGGVCKKCPDVPGQCESHCTNTTATQVECTKFCRTVGVKLDKARATAAGQMQSVTKTIAREIGCFVEKVTKCTITASSKVCTQTKSAKALYDCPADKARDVPLRLSDGTETFGFRSICDKDDLECQIQNCGRTPDSNKCMSQAMLV